MTELATGFDYNIVAELLPVKNEPELVSGKRRRHRRYPVGYCARCRGHSLRNRRELSPELLPNACLEVGKKIFDRDGIRRLYDSEDYPLVRRGTPVERLRQSDIRFRA